MSRKIIFLDIDGTLTEPGKNTPPDSAIDAIKKARSNGHLVLLCSGRNYGMLSPLLKYEFDGLIGSAGGYVVCNDEVIYDCPLSDELYKKTMDAMHTGDIYCTIEGKMGSFTDNGLKDFLRQKAGAGSNSELLRLREQLENELGIRPMTEYDGQPIYKVLFMCSSTVELQEPRRILEKDLNFCIQDTDKYGIINGELINRKFNKGTAIQKVCDYLGASLDDTIGFGDSMNDLEMIETVKIGVCMDNGSPTLKELSDMICPSVSNDGLMHAFKKLELC